MSQQGKRGGILRILVRGWREFIFYKDVEQSPLDAGEEVGIIDLPSTVRPSNTTFLMSNQCRIYLRTK